MDHEPTHVWKAEAGLVGPRWGYVALGAALFAIGMTMIASASGVGLAAFFGAAIAVRYGLASVRIAGSRRAVLRVGKDGEIVHGEHLLVQAGQLAQASLVPEAGCVLVRLDRRGARLPRHVHVADEAQGRDLVRVLGFDADHASVEMQIASWLLGMSWRRQTALVLLPLLAVLVGLFGAAALPALHAEIVGGALVSAIAAYVFAITASPTTVRVGTDGIHVRWLGRGRYIPLGTVASSATYDQTAGGKRHHGVQLKRRDGSTIRLPTGQTDVGARNAARLHRRILDAAAARRRGADAPAGPIGETVRRGERSLVAWLRDLRRLGQGAHGHRTPAVPRDGLLRIVEDSRADEDDRAGAALALALDPDAAARDQIRIAAETSASPKLRVLLARIAEVRPDDDDDALAAALEPLAEGARSRAS